MSQEDEVDPLKKLSCLRGGNRAVVTKHQHEIDTIIATFTNQHDISEKIPRMNSIATTLKEKRRCLKALDEQILDKIDYSSMEKEIEEASDWETRIYECLEKIEAFNRGGFTSTTFPSHGGQQSPGLSTVQATGVGLGATGVPQGTGAGGFGVSHEFTGGQLQSSPIQNRSLNRSNISTSTGIRLPKINLPTFNGELTQFNSFWQSFECAVHNNESISNIHKLNYLLNVLEGNAHRAVAGLQLSEENYENAIEILKQRFGNKQQIISSHMQALLKLQGYPNEKVSQLRFIYDKINIHVRGLETLGVSAERYGSLLIPIIMSRMPSEITIQVARKITEEIWPIAEILEIIRAEITVREVSAEISITEKKPTSQRPKSPQGTTKTFFTKGDQEKENTVTCYFCQKEHFSISCTEITDPQKRQEILKKARRCFKCMKLGHSSRDCDKKCRKCEGNHHQAICFKRRDRSQTVNSAPQRSQVEKTVTATSSGKGGVLLQTATAYAYGADKNKKIMVNVLFDGGSQRSYVTDELKSKLSLNVENKEILNINTFGSDKYQKKKCDVVIVNLELVDESVIAISALSYPVICSPISSRIDVSEYPHLQGLTFADSPNKEAKRTDILIGMNYYHKIVTGEVKRGSSGPAAVSSKLGWLLSGPYEVDNSNETVTCTNVSSHLTLDCFSQEITDKILDNQYETDEIRESLKLFWEHESLGIAESPETQENKRESVVDEQHENEQEISKDEFEIKFNGKRYEVKLPWKDDIDNILPTDYDYCLKRLNSLHGRLKENPELLNEYDSIFKDQLKQGVIEQVPEGELTKGMTHFICHHAVIRKDHDTTKVRVVFDGSAKSSKSGLSLNERLKLGDNYLPHLFETILSFRCHTIAITADIEKAFLQIDIDEADRDSLRFLWFNDVKSDNPSIVQMRCRSLLFGLRPSPNILSTVIRKHISNYEHESPQAVKA